MEISNGGSPRAYIFTACEERSSGRQLLDCSAPFGPDHLDFDGQAAENTFTGLIALNEVHGENLPGVHIWR
jgi:hypothetical protein